MTLRSLPTRVPREQECSAKAKIAKRNSCCPKKIRFATVEDGSDVYGDAQLLPFANGVFDTVVCFQVLEHVAEPWTLVAEAARVLRPGGCFLLTAPMHYHIHGEPHDYFRYTRYGLISLVERVDLHPLECAEQGGGWVAVSESILNYITLHYWRTVRNQALARAACRIGNRFFGWLDRRLPYPGNPSNLTLVAQKPP